MCILRHLFESKVAIDSGQVDFRLVFSTFAALDLKYQKHHVSIQALYAMKVYFMDRFCARIRVVTVTASSRSAGRILGDDNLLNTPLDPAKIICSSYAKLITLIERIHTIVFVNDPSDPVRGWEMNETKDSQAFCQR